MKWSLVPDFKLTGSIHTIRLLYRSAKSLAEADLYIASSLFKGHVLAVYMESPLCKVVPGKVTGVLSETRHNIIMKPPQPPWSALIGTGQVAHEGEIEDITSWNKGREGMAAAAGKEGKQQNELPVPRVSALDFIPEELP